MLLDVDDAILAITQSLSWVVSTQSLNEIVSIATDLLRELQHVNALQDDVISLHGV